MVIWLPSEGRPRQGAAYPNDVSRRDAPIRSCGPTGYTAQRFLFRPNLSDFEDALGWHFPFQIEMKNDPSFNETAACGAHIAGTRFGSKISGRLSWRIIFGNSAFRHSIHKAWRSFSVY